MAVLHIVVPLANEFHKNDYVFLGIGPNTRRRIDDLHAWWKRTFHNNEQKSVWMTGAGTDAQHEAGPTLAGLMAQYLLEELQVSEVVANYRDTHAWGTAEEIAWVIATAHSRYPGHELRFVFGTQPRHLARVKCILRLFHPNVSALFVSTGCVREIPLAHEGLAYLKLLALLCGLERVVLKVRRAVSLRIDKA